MATIRDHYGKWQALVRIQGHPDIIKSFTSRTDAKRFALETEVKLRREDAGIAKIKFQNLTKQLDVMLKKYLFTKEVIEMRDTQYFVS